jgi:hypothetical protein
VLADEKLDEGIPSDVSELVEKPSRYQRLRASSATAVGFAWNLTRVS